MSSFLVELWSTEKSYIIRFKEISLCSSFVETFDMLSKQILYQLMILFTLNGPACDAAGAPPETGRCS